MIICSVYIPILTDLFHQLIQIDKDEIKEIEDDTRKWVQIIVGACEKNNIEWTKEEKIHSNVQKLLDLPMWSLAKSSFGVN